MDWLQDHMRKHLAQPDGDGNILRLRAQAQTPPEQLSLRAVKAAERVIQHIRDTEQDAADRHARSEAIARDAIEELSRAEERMRAAEQARRASEARCAQADAKLRSMEADLERATANAAAFQTKLSVAERAAREAERRATEAETALKRIETMIDALFVQQGQSMQQTAA